MASDPALVHRRMPRVAADRAVAAGFVREATESYLADQDNMGQWLEECTHDGGQFAFTLTSTLFASWKAWCEDRNLKPGSASALSEALADRGFAKKREPGTGRRGFAGLTIGHEGL